MNYPTIRHVCKAIQANILNHQGEINQALTKIEPSCGLKSVLPYFTTNVDAGMYSLLMISQGDEQTQWYGMPNIALETYSCTVYGVVHHEEPEKADDLIGVLGAAVKYALNQHHLPVDVGDGFEIFFNETAPISRIGYGIPPWGGNTLLRAFEASFTSSVEIQIKDERSL